MPKHYYIPKKEFKEADLYKDKDKIKAIKAARDGTGLGLRESKEWVESGCLIGHQFEWGVVLHKETTVSELMHELFTLTERMAEIHNRLNNEDYRDE